MDTPPDDIRPDNAPSNPKLLDVLTEELIRSRYDLKHLFRQILNSSTYQQSSIKKSEHRHAEALFAHYIPRRLPAGRGGRLKADGFRRPPRQASAARRGRPGRWTEAIECQRES